MFGTNLQTGGIYSTPKPSPGPILAVAGNENIHLVEWSFSREDNRDWKVCLLISPQIALELITSDPRPTPKEMR
jgi:hypothetical protein